MTSDILTIAAVGDHPTIRFARAELADHLELMLSQPHLSVQRVQYDRFSATADVHLWVGLASDFPDITLLDVEDSHFDDAITIKTRGSIGMITGNNPRSVLLAVYRYLHELGCRWVRPGPQGEYIPPLARTDLERTAVNVTEAPSYRHRGVCIEGSVDYSHVREIIHWLPKVGMNSYYIQFREGFTFFERWYSGDGNPLRKPMTFTVEDAQALVHKAAAEIKQRDLLFHAVGHGWTCEPFGMRGLGWDYPPEPVPPEAMQYLALVNGKRELWGGVPLNTNLCYSNPDVRRIVTESIVEYAAQHPEVDFLHFWLADGSNNHCECESCQKTRPADFYVMMLNEMDRLLTERGLDMRIVFLIYVDLLWPPETERIHNPDRFILMFAPITRSYSKPYRIEGALPALPPFERNKLTFPRNVEENVAFLRAWQERFDQRIDSFDYDYHLMWDHHRDPGYMQTARVLHEDLRLLEDLNINGFNSCQTQRACFPTGLPMTLMGWTLWNRERDFDEMARDYFAVTFGPDGAQVRAYLEKLSELFDPVYLRGEKAQHDEAAAAQFGQIPAVIDAFRATIARNESATNVCHRTSWNYLRYHANVASGLARSLEARALGNKDEAFKHWEGVKRYVWEHEDALNQVLDIWLFVRVYNGLFKRD